MAKLLHIDTKNLWPAVIDALSVDKGYEAALGAALGDDLEAPIDPSAPMRWAGATIDPTDPALPDGVEALGEHVKAPQELARRLAQIGVIGREQAGHLAPLLKPGQRLVSREGDLWRWDGFSVAANAPTGAARRLAGKNRLTDIEAELDALRREVDAKQTVVTAAETEVASAAEAEAAARTRWRALQHEAHAARDRFAEAEREMARNTARLSALGEAKARLTANRDEAVAARDDAERALTALPPALDIETRLASVKGDIESQRTRLAEVRAEAQALAREAEIAARRLAAIAAERQAWSGRNDSAAVADQDPGRARRRGQERARRPRRRPARIRREASRADQRDRDRGNRPPRRGRSSGRRRERACRSRPCRAGRAGGHGHAREEAARAEERFEGGKRRLADVAHEILEMLEVEPAEVANLAAIDTSKALPEVAEVEANLERLRRDRERLGAVNLRAEEELREVETQHGSLTAERDDLVEAIKRLRQGIQNLNREARERLLASFEVVNTHFKHLFTQLFGGGTAELQLIENEDPLEAGLEIIARPPGKKPATLVAPLGRRAGAHRAGAHLRRVPHQPGADLRAGRGRRAARRSQCRSLLRPARRDDAIDRHALRDHHPQSDQHGADEPALWGHHGGARGLPARVRGSPRRGEAARSRVTASGPPAPLPHFKPYTTTAPKPCATRQSRALIATVVFRPQETGSK